MVEFILRKGPLAIRRLAEGDSEILSRWLSNPQVLQFYGGRDQPYDLERVQLKFYEKDGISRCIVEWEGVPIGYVQFYPVGAEEKREYGHIATEGLWGMDQFIGESNYWNKESVPSWCTRWQNISCREGLVLSSRILRLETSAPSAPTRKQGSSG